MNTFRTDFATIAEETQYLSALARESKTKGCDKDRTRAIRSHITARSRTLGFHSNAEMFDFAGKRGDFRRWEHSHARVLRADDKPETIVPRTGRLLRMRTRTGSFGFLRTWTPPVVFADVWIARLS